MAQSSKGHPGGAWYLPALEACRFQIDGNSIVDGAPLPKNIGELHKLIARYREALQRTKDSLCPFGMKCNSLHELLKKNGVEFTFWSDLSKEQLDQYQAEAIDLFKKYFPS
jgi:hypothetical protein